MSHASPLWHKRAFGFIVYTLVLSVSAFFLRYSTWHGSLDLHTVMEALSTLLAILVGAVALVRFYAKADTIFLLIGVGLVGTAALDLFHTIATSSSFINSFPTDADLLLRFTWLPPRLLLAIFLFLAYRISSIEERRGKPIRVNLWLVYGVVAVLMVLTPVMGYLVPIHDIPYRAFTHPLEIIPGIFFFLAFWACFKKGKWKTDDFDHWFIPSLISNVMSQVAFMSFSKEPLDAMAGVGHLLKIYSYVSLVIGLIINIYYLFKESEDAKDRLKQANLVLEQKIIETNRLTEELSRSNRELEHFAYVASHDLQEPLRKVTAFTERLQAFYHNERTDLERDYMNRIKNAALRMRQLIEDLLQFSRVASRVRPFEPVPLAAVIEDVVSDLEWRVTQSGAQIDIADLPAIVGDRFQIGQLFLNLIGNALKFRKAGAQPQVVVASRVIADGEVEITVADNGVGFDEKYLDRIFEPFQRLHTHSEYEGTGIGLAICHKIIIRHGGTITASSTPGEGATFKVTLPLAV